MRLYAFILGNALSIFGVCYAAWTYYQIHDPIAICVGVPYIAIGSILTLPHTFIILQKKA